LTLISNWNLPNQLSSMTVVQDAVLETYLEQSTQAMRIY
jgi:hypothetical protein